MGKVCLEGMEFYAFHGIHHEEHRIGNRYTVDIILETDTQTCALSDNVADTLDYTGVYEIARDQMAITRHLLETVSYHIGQSVLAAYPTVQKVTVRVSKQQPPFGGLCKRAYVEQELARK